MVLAILGFAVFDALRPAGSSSHLGLLVRQIVAEGPSALVNVAVRKLAMNLRLMRYTIWSDVLVAFIVAFGLLLYRPVGLMRRLVEANPHLREGL